MSRIDRYPGQDRSPDASLALFEPLEPRELLEELRLFVEGLDLDGTVFRANHASNYLPLGGRFPKDKPEILAQIDRALRGETGLRPDFLRGL